MKLLDKERDVPLAEKLWEEGNIATEDAIAKVKLANQSGNLPAEKIDVVFAGMDRFVRRDLAKHPANNVDELKVCAQDMMRQTTTPYRTRICAQEMTTK